jgi:hypothetical protein
MADIETTGVRESIIKAIKSKTDQLTFDSENRLAIQDPPSLNVSLSTRASESTLSSLSSKFPIAVYLSDSIPNTSTTIVGSALLGFDSDGSLWRRVRIDSSGRLVIQNLDVSLSSFSGKFPSAASLSDSLSNPSTTIIGSAILGFDGSYWRRVRVDTSGRLAIQNQPNFDVALSTRASEATLSAIKNALASVGTDKLRTSVVDSLPESPFNITKVGGTAVTGRDWSGDFAKLQNLDIALSAFRDFFRPIIKGSIFNQLVTANTNIFSSDLTPSLATTNNPSYFRIFACFNASGVLSVVKTKGATTVTMQLNSGNALNANALYAFDIAVESGESINLRYSVDATALELKVEEIASVV